MIVNRGHTWIRNIGDVPTQMKPERGTLGHNLLFNALFDCLHKDAIHLLEGEAAAGKMGHLRGEVNEEVGKIGRMLPVGQINGSSINQGKSLELRFLNRTIDGSFENGFLENYF